MGYQPIKGNFTMEYDANTGESYPVFEKKKTFDASQSPKMYYRLDELQGLSYVDHEIIRIAFTNNALILPYVTGIDSDIKTSMIMTTIEYKKIYFKNAKEEFVFVQIDQIDLFFKIMLNKELTKEEKKYI